MIPAHLIKEFDPDKGDIVLPGGMYQDLDFKHAWERREVPAPVELSPDMEQILSSAVNQMSASHQQMRKLHKAKPITLKMPYDSR